MVAFQVQGKNAIITGAGSGINLSFAKLLLSKGCNVLIADLALRPEAQTLVEEYRPPSTSTPASATTYPDQPTFAEKEGPLYKTQTKKPLVVFHKTDVTSWPDLSAAFAQAIAVFGGLDIVVPGAGVFDPEWSNFWIPPTCQDASHPHSVVVESEDASSSTAAPPASVSRDSCTASPGTYTSLSINVTHPIRLTQLAIGHFTALHKPGSIVLLSSIAGQSAAPFSPLYFAAKHAINGFVWSLASLEQAVDVRVTAVAPGLIRTPLWTESSRNMSWRAESDAWVEPEDVAEVMLSLIEGEDNVGGTILEVGRHVRRVGMYNDPGPSGGEGLTMSHAAVAVQDVFDVLKRGDFKP